MGNFSSGKNIWYSDARPQGTGNEGIEYNASRYDQVDRLISSLHGKNKITNKEVKAIQGYLVEVGYLDSTYTDRHGNVHNSIDGFVGGRTHGAARRYLINFGSSRTMDYLKFWD